jgi:integrase
MLHAWENVMSVRKRKWTTAKGEAKSAWVTDYVDGGGRRRLRTFAKKKDADAFAATATVEIREGVHVAESATVTVTEAGELWMTSGANDGLEQTTIDQRRQHLDLHITPFLGREKLSKLSVPVVRGFQDKLRDKGRSVAMVKRVTVSLGSLLADAQDRGLVVRNAVREMTRKTRRRGGERRQKRKLEVGVDIPTPDEIRAILEAANGRYRPLLVTAIFTGCRASELRGLRWQDVDLEKGVLHVRQRADRYHVEGLPKSDAGQRSLPLSPLVVNTLREWKLQCPRRNRTKDSPGQLYFVFPNAEGNVEWHANIINRGLKPTLIAAGVTAPAMKDGKPVLDENGNPVLSAKHTGLHSLRHWYASWLINRRADGGHELMPKIVQSRMGHSSIQMTLDVYGHLFPAIDEAEALAEAERALLSPPNAT